MIRTPPRGPYQQEAVERALEHDGFLLLAEQRTGKCWMSLSVVDRRKPDHLWIICPIAAIKTWKEQIAQHLGVDWECKLVIINYEELAEHSQQYYRKAKKLVGTKMIIADEIHKIKNRGKARSRSARVLARRFNYRLGLTGTPWDKGIHEAWAEFNFIAPEVFGPWDSKYDEETGRLLEQGFVDAYCEYGGFRGMKIVGYKNEKDFYEKFHSRAFRITLREARGKERPLTLRHTKVWFDLNPESRALYSELEEKLIVEVNRKKVKVPVVVALSMKLQQIAGGFVIDSEEKQAHQVGSEALSHLKRLANFFRTRGDKFVVVARFLHEIEAIHKMLRGLGITTKWVIGGMPYDGKFDTDAILIQVQSGVAVDMGMANHTIFYSTDFSYINYDQVKFRTLNFDKPFASFYYLLARDTIAEQIYQAVRRKKNLAHLVLDKYRRKQRHVRES